MSTQNKTPCAGKKFTCTTDINTLLIKSEADMLNGLGDGEHLIAYTLYNNGGAEISVTTFLQDSERLSVAHKAQETVPAFSKKSIDYHFTVNEGSIGTNNSVFLCLSIGVSTASANGLNMIPAGTEIILASERTNIIKNSFCSDAGIEASELEHLPDNNKNNTSSTPTLTPDPRFHVSGAFGSYMVLQRDTNVPVWGISTFISETVTVEFKGQIKTAKVGTDGKWMVILDSMPADKCGATLTASCNGITQNLIDVLVGDVFFIGGQSNADMPLSSCRDEYSDVYKEQLIKSGEGNIRFFRQGKLDTKPDRTTMDTPQYEPINGNVWTTEELSTANTFCAFGFFFGHKIYDMVSVPIGLVMVASAGSPVSQLMSKEASLKTGYDRYENSIPVCGMYNALMNPFIKMSFKAMLYFQGESEQGLAVTNYGLYNEYLNAYVEDLREKNGNNFPFYYAQVGSYSTEYLLGMHEQRAVMFDGLKVIKNSGMIVTMDKGSRKWDPDWAHAKYKEPIGERFANLVLAKAYGLLDANYVLSPMPIKAKKTSDGVIITFENVGDGLKRIGQHDVLTGFKAITKNGYIAVTPSILSKDTVLLDTSKVGELIGVGYGLEIISFVDYPEGDGDLTYVSNLGNSAGYPAPTFKLFL